LNIVGAIGLIVEPTAGFRMTGWAQISGAGGDRVVDIGCGPRRLTQVNAAAPNPWQPMHALQGAVARDMAYDARAPRPSRENGDGHLAIAASRSAFGDSTGNQHAA
jgi:hypothetical protein